MELSLVLIKKIKNHHITNNFYMNKFTKEIINSVPVIAFCGLITSIFLGFTIVFLEWTFKFLDWDVNFGSLYLSLNIFQKLLVLWFLGIPLYFVYKKIRRT